MSLALFLSRKIYGNKADHKSIGEKSKNVSRPAIQIAIIGIAIGLAVMIVTVSVVLGFKHTIRDKLVGFGSHIQVENIIAINTSTSYPTCINDSILNIFKSIDGIRHAERFTLSQGIIKTDSDFLGIAIKGIGPEYDLTFMREQLVEGEFPEFCDTASNYPLVISQTIANKLNIKVGDRIFSYFISENGVKTRRFNICAIYQTNMKRFDDNFCLTDIYAASRINGWSEEQCSGAELLLNDFSQLDKVNRNVVAKINRSYDKCNNIFSSRTIHELYPQVFSWLDLLDLNVWIILGMMVILAGFTMTSGLLIIILERTQMIGILKALGASNALIRKTFIWFGIFVIGRGLFWGNLIGIGIILIQNITGIITLDPQTYYVAQAPMEFDLKWIIILNLATLLINAFILIAPSYLVSKVNPAHSMRYE